MVQTSTLGEKTKQNKKIVRTKWLHVSDHGDERNHESSVCYTNHLRCEGLEDPTRSKLVALSLGLREDNGVRALAVVRNNVLQRGRAMPEGHLDRHVLHRLRQLVILLNGTRRGKRPLSTSRELLERGHEARSKACRVPRSLPPGKDKNASDLAAHLRPSRRRR